MNSFQNYGNARSNAHLQSQPQIEDKIEPMYHGHHRELPFKARASNLALVNAYYLLSFYTSYNFMIHAYLVPRF